MRVCVNPAERYDERYADLSELILLFLLTAHLLTMNLASAGPLVCIWLRIREKETEQLASQLGRSLAWFSVAAMIAGMVIGGVILLLPSSDPLWDALSRFPTDAYWNAGFELLFSLVCLVVYASGWRLFGRHRWIHALVALMSASNLLYHFPPLMTVIGKLAANPAWTSEPIIDRSVSLQLMARENAISLSVHFAFASLAVAGVTTLLLLARRGEPILESAEGRCLARVIGGIVFGATISQLPVGAWVLATMSPASRGAVMGTSPIASLMFFAGVLLAILLMGRLLAITLGEVCQAEIRRVLLLLLLTTLMMTATMRYSRASHVGASTQPASSASSFSSSLDSGSFCTSSNGPPGSLLSLIRSP